MISLNEGMGSTARFIINLGVSLKRVGEFRQYAHSSPMVLRVAILDTTLQPNTNTTRS